MLAWAGKQLAIRFQSETNHNNAPDWSIDKIKTAAIQQLLSMTKFTKSAPVF
jgi:hypothetical protein